MAPELLSDDICGKEADIWGFGCILYEMVFRRSPFFDSSEGMVWKRIQNEEIDYHPEEYQVRFGIFRAKKTWKWQSTS